MNENNSKDDLKLPTNNMFQSRFLEVLSSLGVIVDVLNYFSVIRRKWSTRQITNLKKGPNFHFWYMILAF